MGIALVQAKNLSKAASTDPTVGSFNTAPVAGCAIIVVAGTVSSSEAVVSVEDNAGNTYVPATAQASVGYSIYYGGVQIWVAYNCAVQASHEITVTYAGWSNSRVLISEWSGIALSDPRDAAAINSAQTLDAPYDFAIGSVTPVAPNELVLAVFNAPSPSTIDADPPGMTALSPFDYQAHYYVVQTTPAAINPTISYAGSEPVCGAVASFRGPTGWVPVRDWVEQEIPSSAFPGGVARVLGDLWSEDPGGSPLPTLQARLYNITDSVSVGESAELSSADYPSACDFSVTLTPGTKRYRAEVTSDPPAVDIFFSGRGVGP